MKNQSRIIKIAEQIIELDLLRDELYEELMTIAGSGAFDILRQIQNTELVTTFRE